MIFKFFIFPHLPKEVLILLTNFTDIFWSNFANLILIRIWDISINLVFPELFLLLGESPIHRFVMERIITTPSLESAQLGLCDTTHYSQIQLFIQLVYSIFHIIE